MSRDPIKHALAGTYGDVFRNHTLQMAAALSYYFVLSLFPSLIVLSAIVAYLPVPNLFDQAMSTMARFLPPDSMGLVRTVLSDVITPNRGTFLSFGILGTVWTASGGFAAAIEALNIAYDVEDDRPGRVPGGATRRWRYRAEIQRICTATQTYRPKTERTKL
jgi:membrane protein